MFSVKGAVGLGCKESRIFFTFRSALIPLAQASAGGARPNQTLELTPPLGRALTHLSYRIQTLVDRLRGRRGPNCVFSFEGSATAKREGPVGDTAIVFP
jgi:hypothetical protein